MNRRRLLGLRGLAVALVVLGTAGAAVAWVGGSGDSDGARLTHPTANDLVWFAYDTRVDRDENGRTDEVLGMTLGGVCLDRPGEIRVLGVQALDGDLEVSGFWVLPAPWFHPGSPEIGDFVGPLAEQGLPPSTDPLTIVCTGPDGLDGDSHQLVIEMQVPSTTASAEGLVVSYESGGEERHLEIDEIGWTVCVDPPDPDPRCRGFE
jgi:hypothetical protein